MISDWWSFLGWLLAAYWSAAWLGERARRIDAQKREAGLSAGSVYLGTAR